MVDITDACRALLEPDVSRLPAGMTQPGGPRGTFTGPGGGCGPRGTG
jgi:hypothetical protein